jgi:hypothetical protein
MHKSEEPGAKVGTALPATLLGNRPDEGVLDEVVCPGPMGMTGISKSQVSRLCVEIDDKIETPLGWGAP